MAGLCRAAAGRARHRHHEAEARDGKFLLSGLRDPLAVDPLALLARGGDRPGACRRRMSSLIRRSTRNSCSKRLQASLNPPPSVTLAVEGDRIVAQGSAPSPGSRGARTGRHACCRQGRRSSTVGACATSARGRSANCAMRSRRADPFRQQRDRCRQPGRTKSSISWQPS